MGQDNITQKINSLSIFSDDYLVRMKIESKIIFQKISDRQNQFFQMFFAQFVAKLSETRHRPMGAFSDPAGVGIENETLVKNRV